MTAYRLTHLTDEAQIRTYLLSDENYAAYALGDLDPPYSAHAIWIGAEQNQRLTAVALHYTGLKPEVLFLMGELPALNFLLENGVGSKEVYYTAKPDVMNLLHRFYSLVEVHHMFRMRVTAQSFAPLSAEIAKIAHPTPLCPGDADAMGRLLKDTAQIDGRGLHDIAFAPDMLADGYFYGLWDGGALIAAAGTHVVARRSRIAAVGNVVVHPEHRARRLGAVVSQAVTQALMQDGFDLIVLNVRQNNAPAVRTYERLGYQHMGKFIEGLAQRR